MTPVRLCEPLFRYVCRLNRSARKGGTHELSQVRGEVQALLADARSRADQDPRLTAQFERLQRPLRCFVDEVIAGSRLPFAGEWPPLAETPGEPPAETFFRLLDETLAETTPEAAERLRVFYVCLGLGVANGRGDPETVRQKMLECAAGFRDRADLQERARLCPDAYEYTDTRDLTESLGPRLGAITIALIGLVVALFIANIYLFRRTGRELEALLDNVFERDRPAAEAVAPPPPAPERGSDDPS